MSKEIIQMKRAIGAFFRNRREKLGWLPHHLRDRTNTSGTQIDALETGDGNVRFDTFLKVMLEEGIAIHLTEQNADEAMPVTMEGASVPPPFLLCADAKTKQLYVLHWQRPAFLVQVVQTIPHTLRFVATYGATTQEIRKLPVMAELEAFVKKAMRAAQSGN